MKILLVTVLLLFTMIGSPVKSATIILTSDKQLNDLLDPDKKIDLSTGRNKRSASLREICETAQKSGDKTLTIAFDEFFRQYREQAGTDRRLTPDMDEYVDKIKVIADFAAKYQMGIGLSLLSPLELGPAYKKFTGVSGRWVNYEVGYRDPVSGKFSQQMWQQLSWTNNKGKFQVKLKNVRAFAFRESPVGNSPFRAVAPSDIIEIKGVKYEALDTVRTIPTGELWVVTSSSEARDMYFESRNLRVYYDGELQLKGYNRVMVLLEYETPEMDYFSPQAMPFLKNLLKKYHDKGINLVSLYSDEMHIQQDWYYFVHHQNGQFNSRYLTRGFSDVYKQKFGQELEDRELLYFAYGAPTFETGAKAVRNVQYVMGRQPEEIQKTFLLRDRYYKMLNHGVADLFKGAKDYGSSLFGKELTATGHSSWAESPTIDLWDTEKLKENAYKYEYTSNYVWGNTVQQAAAACYDYFKWGEYLEPTGNDFAECGWMDRNYYGAAMSASIGVINKYPTAYAAAWGMPDQSRKWKAATNSAFGASDRARGKLEITGGVHRDIEVLILYPMNLVAVEERFGSWMTQYAYANYLTSEKLLEIGQITEDGYLKVRDKKYRTLVAIFEPFPAAGLLKMMNSFAEKGGKIVWCGPPPMIGGDGANCSSEWQKLFGVSYSFDQYMGEIASGRVINFQNSFSKIPSQTILTDFLVDRIYPVIPEKRCEILAASNGKVLGTQVKTGKGQSLFFGFRPRDDQSASLGYETRTLFEILNNCGSYAGSGKFPMVNDNPTCISRTTDYLATSFPNGSNMIVRHYRTHAESWDGGFSRSLEADKKALELNPMPSDTMILKNLKINGHQLTYNGKLTLTFRTDAANKLIAFEGHSCKEVTVDGQQYRFSKNPFETITFAPDPEKPAQYFAILRGEGIVQLPSSLAKGKIINVSTFDNQKIPFRLVDGKIELNITPEISGKKLRIE
ncbi:MAG: hypothetical protein WCK18_05465 [Prolixibacteraceae bacterium]